MFTNNHYNFTELNYSNNNIPILYFKNVCDSYLVLKFIAEISSLKPSIVSCGIPNVSWHEKQCDYEKLLYQYLTSKTICEKIITLTDRYINPIIPPKVWVSEYSARQYINPHTDSSGVLQILFCLQNTSKNNGGNIYFKVENDYRSIHLNQGDMIIFDATITEHYTDPTNDTNCLRQTVCCRFFKR